MNLCPNCSKPFSGETEMLLGVIIYTKEFWLPLDSWDNLIFCVEKFYLSCFSVFCTIGTFFSDCSHLDCTYCTVSHGPYRNLCKIPGDPLYCGSYYWTLGVYWGHNFWRPDWSSGYNSLALILEPHMILGWNPNLTYPTRLKSSTASERWMFKYWSHISASKLGRKPVVK